MSLDLRTGRSVWLNQHNPSHSPPLTRDISTNVVVIGAGISGALVAHALTDLGVETLLIDRRDVAAGSTAASTAILSYEPDCHLTDLIESFGAQAAVRIFQSGVEALHLLEELTGSLDDDCGFGKTSSLYFASSRDDEKPLRAEYHARKKHHFDTEYIEETEVERLFSFGAPCALVNPHTANVDPVRLTRSLVRCAQKKGLQVFADTSIKKYDREGNQSILTTDRNHTLRAKHVVFATGYESQQFLMQPTVRLTSTYALATEPLIDLTGWYERMTIWESARPYLYLRVTPDNRLVAGGEDEDFVDEDKRDALLAQKTHTLERRLQRMFPAISIRVETAWTGTFAESEDTLPYIGTHERYPGAYFALGYGGNGITFSAIASQIIPDLILDKETTDAALFGFTR